MVKFSKIIFLSLLIFTVGFSACKKNTKTQEKAKTTKVVKKKKESPKPIVKAKPIVKKKLKPEVEKRPNKYFLIVASFQKQANAERMQEQLNKNGYNSEIHPAANGFYRVSYKSFSDRKLAFKELKNVRSTEEHHDTWLYIKR
ncbi:SPOR domain-containing protein [Ancylomarina longa]|uniref:SPOR domain-containing protein n=1 Tax=Ancylomarina longa TaxID=2487017 RepID=A0A434AFP1_9BACT|nr:SPOR domain-containing protein [Ancylomarina longa]RUT73135.1 SPOR domain-containing protein [Ancylomarina longa]